MSSGDELAKAVNKKRVLALEFLVIVCEANDGLGASPGPPGRRRLVVLEVQASSSSYAPCRPRQRCGCTAGMSTASLKRLKCRKSQ